MVNKRSLGKTILVFCLLLSLIKILPENWLIRTSELLALCIFALAYNFLLFKGGLVSFGQAAFFGLAAYVPALLVIRGSWSPYVALLVGPIASAVFAGIIGLFLMRASSIFYSMLTLAISQILFSVVTQWYEFTNGDQGLRGFIPDESILSTPDIYVVTLITTFLSVMLIRIVADSSLDLALQASRDNIKRPSFLGISIEKVRLQAFVFSGFFSGVAGTLVAFQYNAAEASMLSFQKSVAPLMACLIGGGHSFWGPVLGSFIYKSLEELTSLISSDHWPTFVGGILVVLFIYWPRGFVGMLQDPRWLKWGWRPVTVVTRHWIQTYWNFLFRKRNL